MKGLIVAEGAHAREGALPALVRQLNPAIVNVECEYANTAKVRAVRGQGDGFYKRALRWLIEAENRGHDALVLVIDRDAHKNRAQQMDKAQHDTTGTPLPRAIGVAIEAFEAWILADEQALTKALGHAIPRQKAPEQIKDPKTKCEELRDGSPSELPLREMYEAVMLREGVRGMSIPAPLLRIGVGRAGCPAPLPPNRTWGSPAYGSPVDGLTP